MKANVKKEVTVILNDKMTAVPKDIANNMLKLARESVHNGVYAAKRKDTVIFLNEPEISTERFAELCRLYNSNGFILLHNRGASNGGL